MFERHLKNVRPKGESEDWWDQQSDEPAWMVTDTSNAFLN